MAGLMEIADKIREPAKLTHAQAEEAVRSTLKAIKEECAKGGKVTFIGFGTFSMKRVEAHEAKNPMNGETVQVPTKDKLVLKTTATVVEVPVKKTPAKKK